VSVNGWIKELLARLESQAPSSSDWRHKYIPGTVTDRLPARMPHSDMEQAHDQDVYESFSLADLKVKV